MIRRQIVRLKERNTRILSKPAQELLRDNPMEEPDNEKSIYLWLQAACHYPNMTLDDAIEYLSAWSSRTNQVQALYYHYVHMVLKEMEGISLKKAGRRD
jgi:hypothetical protein